MRKSVILAVLPLFLLAGCHSVEKRTEAFQDQIDKINEKYLTESTRMQVNGVAQEQMQELYDNAIAEIKSISLKTIKQNKNNSLGVLAFKNAIYFMNKEEIDLVLDTLGPNAKEDEFVIRVMSGEIEDIL